MISGNSKLFGCLFPSLWMGRVSMEMSQLLWIPSLRDNRILLTQSSSVRLVFLSNTMSTQHTIFFQYKKLYSFLPTSESVIFFPNFTLKFFFFLRLFFPALGKMICRDKLHLSVFCCLIGKLTYVVPHNHIQILQHD